MAMEMAVIVPGGAVGALEDAWKYQDEKNIAPSMRKWRACTWYKQLRDEKWYQD
jgi:hypothetical protein